jgi:hypothetical protein
VNDRSAFGVRLWRLLARHRPTLEASVESMVPTLAEETGVPEAELHAVLEGAEPSPEIVRRLAPALGIHTADMFVIAGLRVPDDEAAASSKLGEGVDVSFLLNGALKMSPEQLSRLDASVRSMPAQPPTEPAPLDDFPEGPGAMLLRLLRNRNIRPHNARLLHDISGCLYVSDSTVWLLGSGHTTITRQFVTAFALLLGYAPDDMAGLIGFGPAAESPHAHPAGAEIAALAWNARRLSSDQLMRALAAVQGS